MTQKFDPPELPGYEWSNIFCSAPWDPSDPDVKRAIVGMSPQGIVLFDRNTNVLHFKKSAKPN